MPIPIEQLIIKIAGDSKEFQKAMVDVQKANKSGEKSFKTFAKVGVGAATAVTSALAIMGAKAFNAFRDYEKGLTNVAKTTKLSGKELDAFSQNITDLSQEIPISTDRLLEIGTAAGQLGIKGTKSLTKFTKTIALLSETTNVDGEDAALTLARLINITGESVDTVDQLGAALVDLGNNFAAQESEILEIAKDVGKATVQFGTSSQAILGMSAAMASLGIQAEAGGTVVGKAFMAIDSAIRQQAGPAFEKLVELTGMSGDQLKQTFAEDSSKVFSVFIKGLGEAGASGRDMTSELAAMGLSGIRVNKILPTLAKNHQILADGLARSSKAYKENTALNEEAATKFGSNAAKWQIAQNKINNAFIKLGAEIAPEVTKAFESIAETISENKEAIGLLAGAINGAIKIIGGALSLVASFLSSLNTSRKEIIKNINDQAAARIKKSESDSKANKKDIKEVKEFTNQWTKYGQERIKALEKERKAREKFAKDKKYIDGWIKQEKEKVKAVKRSNKILADEAKEKKRNEEAKKAAEERLQAQQAELEAREEAELEAGDREFDELQRQNDIKAANQKIADYKELEEKRKLNDEKLEAHIDELEQEEFEEKQSNKRKLAEQRKANDERLEVLIDELEQEEFEEKRHFGKLDDLHAKHNKGQLLSETKFGQQMVRLKEIQGSAEYGATKTAAGELAVLINSENNELKQIGKAATMVQIGMATAESAMKAYSSLAWIPYVGPIAGGLAAATIVAYGLEQEREVASMKTGGIVPGIGGTGIGDKVPTLLEPGELVIPREETQKLIKNMSPTGYANGGAVGEKEQTGMQKTFAGIFNPMQLFKALVLGESEGGVEKASGFGAKYFAGMVGAMMGDLQDAADELLLLFLSQIPGGMILYEMHKIAKVPIKKLKEILGDNEVMDYFEELDAELYSRVTSELMNAGGALEDFYKGVLDIGSGFGDIGSDFIDIIGGSTGFWKDGGVVGMTSPGEMRLSKEALSAIANGANTGNNSSVSTRRISSKPTAQTSAQRVYVDISMNGNAAEIINAQLREGENLGTIIPV